MRDLPYFAHVANRRYSHIPPSGSLIPPSGSHIPPSGNVTNLKVDLSASYNFFLQEMMNNIQRKTMRWEFIKALEPPRVVHVRVMNVLKKTNLFAQVTVRMNTQQVRTCP